jgi:hypothetical protein
MYLGIYLRKKGSCSGTTAGVSGVLMVNFEIEMMVEGNSGCSLNFVFSNVEEGTTAARVEQKRLSWWWAAMVGSNGILM